MMIKQGRDRHCAPFYFDNQIGEPAWSGKHECEIDAQTESELRIFISVTAARKGHNDARYGQLGATANLFTPEFLTGWPYELWNAEYQKGAKR